MQELWVPLLDALAELFVRLHLLGFFWGDCSLSNTLFRRDAGALTAFLVDAETGELHPTLSAGQREHDLIIAEVNVAGELLDLAAGGKLDADLDPAALGEDLVRRYEGLWTEVTRDEIVGVADDDQIAARIRRLNDLGFDVEEVELVGDGAERTLRLKLVAVKNASTVEALNAGRPVSVGPLTNTDVMEFGVTLVLFVLGALSK
jgi:hypothetical protein